LLLEATFLKNYIFIYIHSKISSYKKVFLLFRSCGVDIKTVLSDEIHNYFDWVNTDGIAAANICKFLNYNVKQS